MAISLKLAAPPSDQEVLELSRRNPGLQFERQAAGDLVVTPTGSESGRREAKLVGQLDRWDSARGEGVVFGPSAGFHLPDGSLLSLLARSGPARPRARRADLAGSGPPGLHA